MKTYHRRFLFNFIFFFSLSAYTLLTHTYITYMRAED